MVSPSPSFVTITERWGANPRRIEVGGIRLSWVVSATGRISCLIPSRDAPGLGIADFKGKWIRYEHATAPPWAGVITATRKTPRTWELVAETFHVLLRKRRTPRMMRTLAGPPGGLALRVLAEASKEDPLPITEKIADETGASVRLNARALDLYRGVIPQLLRAGDFEWDIDADRVFRFVHRLGTDKSGSVNLVEGRHVVDYALHEDLWTVVNDVLAIPADQGYADSRGSVIEDSDSIDAYGRLQDTIVVNDVSELAIKTLAVREIARTKDPLATITMTVADTDGCFSWFTYGDTVRVTLGSANTIVACRVLGMALDVDSGRMQITGSVDEVIV